MDYRHCKLDASIPVVFCGHSRGHSHGWLCEMIVVGFREGGNVFLKKKKKKWEDFELLLKRFASFIIDMFRHNGGG